MSEERRRNARHCTTPECCADFIQWMIDTVLEKGWSIDACVGYAKKNHLFAEDQIPCTTSVYRLIEQGLIDLDIFVLPENLSRRHGKKHRTRKNKRFLGQSIEQRDPAVNFRKEFGHWEFDTVVGPRKGADGSVLTLIEKKTHQYIALKLKRNSSECVQSAIESLKDFFGSKFDTVFKTITADNGSEFSDLSSVSQGDTSVFFIHPFSSYEKGQNEHHNRLLPRYIPKGKSISDFSDEEILEFQERINSSPRRSLNYATSNELFEDELDAIYAA